MCCARAPNSSPRRRSFSMPPRARAAVLLAAHWGETAGHPSRTRRLSRPSLSRSGSAFVAAREWRPTSASCSGSTGLPASPFARSGSSSLSPRAIPRSLRSVASAASVVLLASTSARWQLAALFLSAHRSSLCPPRLEYRAAGERRGGADWRESAPKTRTSRLQRSGSTAASGFAWLRLIRSENVGRPPSQRALARLRATRQGLFAPQPADLGDLACRGRDRGRRAVRLAARLPRAGTRFSPCGKSSRCTLGRHQQSAQARREPRHLEPPTCRCADDPSGTLSARTYSAASVRVIFSIGWMVSCRI